MRLTPTPKSTDRTDFKGIYLYRSKSHRTRVLNRLKRQGISYKVMENESPITKKISGKILTGKALTIYVKEMVQKLSHSNNAKESDNYRLGIDKSFKAFQAQKAQEKEEIPEFLRWMAEV